jgi:tetratricopeptide (TPR) repeat protein
MIFLKVRGRAREELILKAERRTLNDERQKKTTKMPSIHHSAFVIQRFEEAEACFQKAIDIARRQQAKSWELRAVVSLSRLWQKAGRRREAYQTLSEVYGWFTEGFDTTDLEKARTLLAELEG